VVAGVASSRKKGGRWGNDGACSEVVRRGKSVSVMCIRTKLPEIFSHGYSLTMVHTKC
jgi:hypothetical protein